MCIWFGIFFFDVKEKEKVILSKELTYFESHDLVNFIERHTLFRIFFGIQWIWLQCDVELMWHDSSSHIAFHIIFFFFVVFSLHGRLKRWLIDYTFSWWRISFLASYFVHRILFECKAEMFVSHSFADSAIRTLYLLPTAHDYIHVQMSTWPFFGSSFQCMYEIHAWNYLWNWMSITSVFNSIIIYNCIPFTSTSIESTNRFEYHLDGVKRYFIFHSFIRFHSENILFSIIECRINGWKKRVENHFGIFN